MVVAGAIAMTGCSDSKYDFNEIDSTIGIGGGGLELPGSSTDTIQLSDVLDIDDSECVTTRENGDYVFVQDGSDVEPARPRINVVELADAGHETKELVIGVPTLPAGATGWVDLNPSITKADDVQLLNYEGEKPEEVVELISARADDEFTLRLTFSDAMKANIEELTDMTVTFPEYMELENVKCNGKDVTVSGSRLPLGVRSTGGDLVITGVVKKLDFSKGNDELGQLKDVKKNGKDMFELNGKVKVSLTFDRVKASIGSAGKLAVNSDMTIGDFTITEATGRFCPDIDMKDLGSTDVTGVPDFLTEPGVKVDLFNPQILLNIDNNVDVAGFVSGTIAATFNDGSAPVKVKVPKMRINPNGKTSICVSRERMGDEADGFYHVPELGKLIERIPDRITFDAEAEADDTRVSTIVLGNDNYVIQPSYRIEAPLAFAAGAKIVYTETIDEWHEDIEDLEFDDNSYLELTGEIVNSVPAYLTLTAEPIDVDGNNCSDKVDVTVEGGVLASSDGVNTVNSDMKITIRQKQKGALGVLDGIVLKVEAAASEGGQPTVTGVTLNEKNHYVIARDIKIRLVGKIIADMN